jgi:predicted  nucleic acid-binding Zn-ribbon protein
LKDQLLLLLELQKIDLRVKELSTAMKALPEKLRPMRQDLAKLETMLAAERARLVEAESFRKLREESIKNEEELLRSARVKLQASRHGKDFAAATREVENRRRSISEREEEVLKIIEAIEKSRTMIESHDKDVESLRAQIGRDQEVIDAQIRELETEVATCSSGREGMRAQVSEKYLRLYDLAITKRGYAIAPVLKGVCQGCHMAVPPQLNNILARLESLESCPRCARLIYRSEFLEPPKTDAPPSGDGSGGAPAA